GSEAIEVSPPLGAAIREPLHRHGLHRRKGVGTTRHRLPSLLEPPLGRRSGEA
ncbi:hypothetical protein H0E87_021639, partial [Populus deltoides]